MDTPADRFMNELRNVIADAEDLLRATADQTGPKVQEVRALAGRAADSRATDPAEASEHILDVLNAAAIATGTVLTTFSTSEAAHEGTREGRRVQLALEGGFHEIVRFLAHLVSRGRVGGS